MPAAPWQAKRTRKPETAQPLHPKNQSTKPWAPSASLAVPPAQLWPFSPRCRNSSKVAVRPGGGGRPAPSRTGLEVQALDLADRPVSCPPPHRLTAAPRRGMLKRPGGRWSLGSGQILQLQGIEELPGGVAGRSLVTPSERSSTSRPPSADPRPHTTVVAAALGNRDGSGQHGVVATQPHGSAGLQGNVGRKQWQQGNRCGLLLLLQGRGLTEVAAHRRQWMALPSRGACSPGALHHHLADDGWTLFGL